MGSASHRPKERVVTGVPRVDDILGGGSLPESATLVRGPPGSSRSIVSLHFPAAGIDAGETALYINLGEPETVLLSPQTAALMPDDDLQFLVDAVVTTSADSDRRTLHVSEFRDSSVRSGHHTLEIPDEGMGVTTLVSSEAHNSTGEVRAADQGTSSLADSIAVLCYVEYTGALRTVVGVLKMRASNDEPQLRELEPTEHGLRVGDSLSELRGTLTGTPIGDGDDGH